MTTSPLLNPALSRRRRSPTVNHAVTKATCQPVPAATWPLPALFLLPGGER
jgi:hypothetical protein